MTKLVSAGARWGRSLAMVAAVTALPAGPSPALLTRPGSAQAPIVRQVTRDEIVAAMRAETGYAIDKTTHASRFQGHVYLRLARRAVDRQQLLRVAHDDWFEAFLVVAGIDREDAPVHVLAAYAHRQEALIDPRPGAVIAQVRLGRHPRAAVNVLLMWPETEGSADAYWFEDTLSSPRVEVHNSRVVTFRLLDFDSWIMFDEVRGSRIRPTTGALATVFRVIGLASVVQVRMSAAADGTAVARATAKKSLIRVTETVTVYPDGRTVRGRPDDRPDLEAVESRLRRALELEYVPLEWDQLVTS